MDILIAILLYITYDARTRELPGFYNSLFCYILICKLYYYAVLYFCCTFRHLQNFWSYVNSYLLNVQSSTFFWFHFPRIPYIPFIFPSRGEKDCYSFSFEVFQCFLACKCLLQLCLCILSNKLFSSRYIVFLFSNFSELDYWHLAFDKPWLS